MASKKAEQGCDDVRLEVPHVHQSFNWDCGLASLQMLLLYYGKSLTDFKEKCAELRFGTSVWTIDLACLLEHYGVQFIYTTITLGVDQQYSNKSFYKDKFTVDEARVNDLFTQITSEKRMQIEERSVEASEIIERLCERKKPVLLLVDWNFLSCKWCDSKCLPSLSCVGRCIGSYQGHYIVLCGYNRTERLFYYKNPAFNQSLCCCTQKTLDTARKSHGTDEDILFIL